MKAVLFDFGGTLDSDGLTWGDRFFLLYREAGLDVARPAFDKAFYKSDDELPTRFELRGLSLEKTVRLQVACVVEQLAPGRHEMTEAVSGRFLEQCREAFARNRPTLAKLRQSYRLGIVSNFYGNLDGVLKSEGLDEFFSVVADSTVVGYLKPDPKLFLHATKALNVKPEECLMVGDSIKRDMKGAEGLDMPHALLSPSGSASCCPKSKRLSSLAGLLP